MLWPLIVFFHGPPEGPASVDRQTGLRGLSSRFRFADGGESKGFFILSPQGRALSNRGGEKAFDSEYTADDNVDVAMVDHFVSELLREGRVDTQRMYTMGASDGGRMAALYAMLRSDRVAAFATYASEGPSAQWRCPSSPPAAMVVYRACDPETPCETVERWVMSREKMGAETASLRLGIMGESEPFCALRRACSRDEGLGNHSRWPRTRDEDILRFLREHALATAP